ncbi:MAG: cupredoxin family copper-binding protein, partial [Bacteroidetes bacterium]|nr:cupredoxin family copper-binding protein [Bacteroidota bacterium]
DFAETLYRLRTVLQQGTDSFTEEETPEEDADTGYALNIKIENNKFSPASLTIAKGTKVRWTNNDDVTHTVTADDTSWGSGNLGKGDTYSKTFTQNGTFTYHCIPHPDMTGTIIVKNANEVPTI